MSFRESVHRIAIELPGGRQTMVPLEAAQRLARARAQFSVDRTGFVAALVQQQLRHLQVDGHIGLSRL